MQNIQAEAVFDFPITTKRNNYKETPIIINSFNRLVCLQKMIDSLESLGYKNIYIIDNCSKYEPLLNYYKTKKLRVFYLNKNLGSTAIWKSNIFNFFCSDYYVYSDPDVIPDSSCPDDFLNRFYVALEQHQDLKKVGFSLRIDDLPEHYHLREQVINHEGKFWIKRLSENLFDAPIDTTFALYRPFSQGDDRLAAGRMNFPCTAQHYSWYLDYKALPDDEKYYLKSISSCTHWSNHIENFSGIQRLCQLVKQDKLIFIWKIRGFFRVILSHLGIKKKNTQ
jgi:glycosyltransferase involved in cell wall biosynthesis